MHGRYCLFTGRSKLARHAVCTVRPAFVHLMNYCHATVVFILLSSASAVVHITEIIYFLKFLTL